MAQFPNRNPNAPTGSQFIKQLSSTDSGSRDNKIVNEILSGNIPEFLKHLVPIKIENNGNILEYKVMPDYLCVGTDNDYVRVPLGANAAQKIVSAFGCTLPTAKMSDQIWKQAQVKLKPQPMSNISGKYTPQDFLKQRMADTNAFVEHNNIIQQQLKNYKPGQLVAGHKKDVILSNKLLSNPNRLALHGWHKLNGKPIQIKSWVHGAQYRDYSQGIRLVDRDAILNGNHVDLVNDVMKNKSFANLISNEGPIQFTTYNKKEPTVELEKDNNISENFKKIDQYLSSLNIGASRNTGRIKLIARLLNIISKQT